MTNGQLRRNSGSAIRDAIRDAQFIPGETDIEKIGRIYNTLLAEGLFEMEK